MAVRVSQPHNGSWVKYGGILLLGIAFLVFLGVLLLSSFSGPLFGKCVAVVDINSEITTASTPLGLFGEGSPGSEDIANAVEALGKRDDVGAVVFVIDSPGGSVVATREIYSAVKALEKPKVSYFRELAASGAYYIATGTDYIVSDPDALTGSIGVVMTLADLSGLLEKVGVNVTEVKSGELKDIGSSTRPMSQKERTILQGLVDEIFQEFKSIVIENRGSRLRMAKFNEILDARVLSGRQAKEIGLVDQLGSKHDAILKAAEMANITDEEPPICQISITPGGSGGLFSSEAFFSGLRSALFPGNDAKKVSIRYE